MKNDKKRLILMAIISVLLLAIISLYGFQVLSTQTVNLGNLTAFAIPLLLIVFMAFFIKRAYADVKHGMPLEDERSKKVITQSSAKAFQISLYWLLCISFFESFFAKMFGVDHLDAGQTIGGAIAGMAVAWVFCWLYYNKKGKLL
ncbi:DUF2178 domain-containing protein [Patescibacteria group bacterium]|nr:DUF2178 domain-containing protein [Patescibacteria group bacterium]